MGFSCVVERDNTQHGAFMRGGAEQLHRSYGVPQLSLMRIGMERARKLLKKYYGYDSFRPGQEELVGSLLQGRDVFGIMPTGAGKSLCYQIPALLLPGVSLVVSPLISLMKDQVSTLNQMGIHAAYLNSSLTPGQYRKALANTAAGQYKIVYVAPERLQTEAFLAAVQEMNLSLLAVDEAHCISQWGQDFRPSYLKIREFVDQLKQRPVIGAFTATATRDVREDVLALLNLKDPLQIVTGFDRKNLRFLVEHPRDKWAETLRMVKSHEGECGIIYCLTRKTVEEVCQQLVRQGFSATRYHAGLSDEERKHNQEDFIYDRRQIMVATNAFGMGIDKSNVRYVIHYNMPKNIESYYQEAGRGGRDGLPSDCLLLYGSQDVVTNQFFIDKMEPPEGTDLETAAQIRERDQERLKKMTFYCFTSDCLRDYILRYFGEYGSGYCGNCTNCLSTFQEEDITETTLTILHFLQSSHRSYGITTITDALHGSKSAKISRTGLDRNPFYGKLEETPVYRLRQIGNFLIQKGILQVEGKEYPVVALAPGAEEILQGKPITMKTLVSRPRLTEAGGGKKKRRSDPASAAKGDADPELFQRLRQLRLELAKAEQVPPYIIFSDKTLTQMCLLHPLTKEEMMEVSGVGEVKYSKYGDRFLAVLRDAENKSTI